MANTTADLVPEYSGEQCGPAPERLLMGAVKLFRGAMISPNATGYLVKATGSGSTHVTHVCVCTIDNSAGAAGDKRVSAETGRIFRFTQDPTNPVDENTASGTLVYATDDWHVGDVGTVFAGQFRGIDSDGKVRVFVDPSTIEIARGLIEPEGA